MIDVTTTVKMRDIEKRLGSMKNQAPTVLVRAVNKTAKDAQKLLFHETKSVYDVKSSQFKSKEKSLKVKKANKNNLTAHLNSTGGPLALYGFKVKADDHSTRARAKKTSSLKAMKVDDRWAFVATMRSGHTGIFQRQGSSRTPIKEFFSVSVPQMIGNESEVYGKLEPEIGELLQKHVANEIEKILAKGG